MEIVEITDLEALDRLGEVIGVHRLLGDQGFYRSHGIRFFKESGITFYRIPFGDGTRRYAYYIRDHDREQLMEFIEKQRKTVRLSLSRPVYERVMRAARRRRLPLETLLQQAVERYVADERL